uniref:glucuronosyltransferase n=1 Tax=Strongyloides papillosus TaxID=174720 RepID=A0A0N5C226_STREA
MFYYKTFIFPLLFLCSGGYKILLFNPKVGHSHINFMSQITKLLINAGHEVIVLSSKIDDTLKNPYHEPGKIYYTEPHPYFVEHLKSPPTVKAIWKSKEDISGQQKILQKLLNSIRYQGISILNDEKLKNFIMGQKFDAAISENMFYFMFGVFKYWGIETTIATTSLFMLDTFYPIFGIPFASSYIPSSVTGYSDKMSYGERTINLLTHLYFMHFSGVRSKYNNLEDVFDEKFGVGFYETNSIITNVSFFFINTNPFLDIPTPKSPKMIEVGGIGIPKSKPVSEEFSKLLNKRNKTILISFGTVCKSTYMDQEMKDEILKTVESFPDITFIWKYETPEDGLGKGIENLVLRKWVPQNDLLNDERLSLFITHGGMGSTTEVAFSYVPALAVPIFGDQMRNARLLERHEIGLAVEKDTLRDSKKFREKILEVLNNDKYKINSIKTAEMLRNRPISSEELLVKHVEFACRFGQLPRLDLASKDMGVIEYYNLDIIVPFLVICFIIIYAIIKIVCTVISKCLPRKIKKD